MWGWDRNPILEHLYYPSKDWDVDPRYIDGRHAILVRSITYTDRRGRKHKCPAGRITDGGSIPRRLWDEIGSPYVFCLVAYIIHDKYCDDACDLVGDDYRKLRKEADDLFLEMLECINETIDKIDVNYIKRRLMYRGVRLGAVL